MADRICSEVWYVSGDEDKLLFDTKIGAEMWARELYPDEDPDTRYGRIYFYKVYGEASFKRVLDRR